MAPNKIVPISIECPELPHKKGGWKEHFLVDEMWIPVPYAENDNIFTFVDKINENLWAWISDY